jgi:starch synthase/alpha-amylase
MIGARYGTLPIVHDTGGLHDTVSQLSDDRTTGNGFVFHHFDSNGLRWAIDQAMAFYRSPKDTREATIGRVMAESASRFSTEVMCAQFFEIYRKLVQDKIGASSQSS